MYIEVYLAGNVIMDMLLLNAASALCSVRMPAWRLAAGGLLGGVYAFAALWCPSLFTIAGKAAGALVLALFIPARGARGYLGALSALIIVSFAAGGLALCLSLCTGGASIRMSYYLIAAAAVMLALMPCSLRRIKARLNAGCRMRLTVRCTGREYTLDALVDTGNTLEEPLSAKPVIIVYIPELIDEAHIPVPAVTLGSGALLMALEPELISVDGGRTPLDALIAPVATPIQGAEALLPRQAAYWRMNDETEPAEMPCKTACRAVRPPCGKAAALLHKLRRSAATSAFEGRGSLLHTRAGRGRRKHAHDADRTQP